MSNREDEVERICQAALDHPRTERERFVSEVCGSDEVLRRDVASRLAYADAASRFLEDRALDIAVHALADRHTLSARQRIGPTSSPRLSALAALTAGRAAAGVRSDPSQRGLDSMRPSRDDGRPESSGAPTSCILNSECRIREMKREGYIL